jgi:hypothetical protein
MPRPLRTRALFCLRAAGHGCAAALLAAALGTLPASAADTLARTSALAETPLDQLTPIELRRAISRAEGRISDLAKTRDAALAALAAAAAAAGARAEAAAADDAPTDGLRVDIASELLDPDVRLERRRAIQARYAEGMAQARAELQRLLAQQARIDADAPDQRRLRDFGADGAESQAEDG